MSLQNPRLAAVTSSLATAAFLSAAALLLLVGTPAFGAPIPISKAAVSNSYITTSAITGSSSVSIPLNPQLTEPAVNTSLLNINPTWTVTGSSFTSSASNSQSLALEFTVNGNKTGGTSPSFTGYGLTGLALDLSAIVGYKTGATGTGFSASDAIPLTYTVSLTEVNFDPLWSFTPFDPALTGVSDLPYSRSGKQVVLSTATVSAPEVLIDLTDPELRASAGIWNPNWAITGVKVQLGVQNSVTVNKAYLSSNINSLSTTVTTELVAVPEPPTVILAGLGVAAVVANGYRRRLRRRSGGDESADTMIEAGVVLTA